MSHENEKGYMNTLLMPCSYIPESNPKSKNPGVSISICLTTQNTPPCRQGAGRHILSGVQSEIIYADESGRHGDMGKGLGTSYSRLCIFSWNHQFSSSIPEYGNLFEKNVTKQLEIAKMVIENMKRKKELLDK